MSWYIISFFGFTFLNIFIFSSTLVLTFSYRRNPYTFYFDQMKTRMKTDTYKSFTLFRNFADLRMGEIQQPKVEFEDVHERNWSSVSWFFFYRAEAIYLTDTNHMRFRYMQKPLLFFSSFRQLTHDFFFIVRKQSIWQIRTIWGSIFVNIFSRECSGARQAPTHL